MTPRAQAVLAKAKQLEVEAKWIGPTIRIDGKTRTVAEADAWLDGYRVGWEEGYNHDGMVGA